MLCLHFFPRTFYYKKWLNELHSIEVSMLWEMKRSAGCLELFLRNLDSRYWRVFKELFLSSIQCIDEEYLLRIYWEQVIVSSRNAFGNVKIHRSMLPSGRIRFGTGLFHGTILLFARIRFGIGLFHGTLLLFGRIRIGKGYFTEQFYPLGKYVSVLC